MLWHARCKKCGKPKFEQQNWMIDNLRCGQGIRNLQTFEQTSYEVDSGVDDDFLLSPIATPLITASKCGAVGLVRSLLDHGACIDEKAPYTDSTALIEAARKGRCEIVELLLDRGAEINQRDIDGVTALYASSDSGYTNVVKLLISRGADVNCQNKDGWTALFPAVAGGHTEIVQVLLQNKAKVNKCDKYGSIPLIFAASNGYAAVTKLLIKAGACVSHVNVADNLTPLIEACYNGQKEIVKLLIAAGSDLSYRTRKAAGDIGPGRTAVMVAAERGHYEIMQMLIKSVNKRPEDAFFNYSAFRRGTLSFLVDLAMFAFSDYKDYNMLRRF